MLSYIYCYFYLLSGTRILGTANAFIYILLLLFTDLVVLSYIYALTDSRASTWYGQMLSNAFIYILLLLFTYGTGTLIGIYLVRQMVSYILVLIGARILSTANAFIYILLLLFTDWYAYTWYGKCFHIYTATFVYLLVGIYLVAFIYILLLLFTDCYAYTWYGKCFHIYTAILIGARILGTANAFIYILLFLFTYGYAYTWYGKCFHIYTATFVYCYFFYIVVRVYLVRQTLSYIYCYFCLLMGTHILGTANAFICIYCYFYFCLLSGTHIFGTANAFIYILLLLFTDWYAHTW